MPRLAIDEHRLIGIEASELKNYECPWARVFVPKPLIPESMLIAAITKENPFLETTAWKVISRGAEREHAQLWELQLNNECVKQLVRTKYKVSLGFVELEIRPQSGESHASVPKMKYR